MSYSNRDLGQHWFKVMAWCLMAPSHYLNQYRLIIKDVLPPKISYTGKSLDINSQSECEKFNCEITSISHWVQWVTCSSPGGYLWPAAVHLPGFTRPAVPLPPRTQPRLVATEVTAKCTHCGVHITTWAWSTWTAEGELLCITVTSHEQWMWLLKSWPGFTKTRRHSSFCQCENAMAGVGPQLIPL